MRRVAVRSRQILRRRRVVREAGVVRLGDRRSARPKTNGCGGRPSCFARACEQIEEANARDLAAAPGYGLTDAEIDRLRLTPQRIEAMAVGLEDRGAAGADRRSHPHNDSAERAADRQSPRAAGRRVFHLRVAAQRDGRRGGDLRQGGQRGDPARRQGSDALEPGDRRTAGRGGRGSRPAGRCGATGEHDRSRRGGQVSCDAAVHRRGDSARRRGADSPRGGRGPDAGHQAFHRQLPRVRRRGGRSRDGRARS